MGKAAPIIYFRISNNISQININGEDFIADLMPKVIYNLMEFLKNNPVM
jgi:hypothetical protein